MTKKNRFSVKLTMKIVKLMGCVIDAIADLLDMLN